MKPPEQTIPPTAVPVQNYVKPSSPIDKHVESENKKKEGDSFDKSKYESVVQQLIKQNLYKKRPE